MQDGQQQLPSILDAIVENLSCGDWNCGCANQPGPIYAVHCPAHDDEHPSLAVTDRRSSAVLVLCHAGCRNDQVIALLCKQGLWPSPEYPAWSSDDGRWRQLFSKRLNGEADSSGRRTGGVR